MEKKAVVDPEVTPDLSDDSVKSASDKDFFDAVVELDSDFTKQIAEKAAKRIQ